MGRQPLVGEPVVGQPLVGQPLVRKSMVGKPLVRRRLGLTERSLGVDLAAGLERVEPTPVGLGG
jgi:hypothetical protein